MANDLYKYLLDERDHESQRYWQIFSVMSVVNGGLLVVVTAQKAAPLLSLLASLLGIALCIVWIQSLRRLRGWLDGGSKSFSFSSLDILDSWTKRPRRPADRLCLPVLTSSWGRKGAVSQGISTRTAAWLVRLFFGLAWLGVLSSILDLVWRVYCGRCA